MTNQSRFLQTNLGDILAEIRGERWLAVRRRRRRRRRRHGTSWLQLAPHTSSSLRRTGRAQASLLDVNGRSCTISKESEVWSFFLQAEGLYALGEGSGRRGLWEGGASQVRSCNSNLQDTGNRNFAILTNTIYLTATNTSDCEWFAQSYAFNTAIKQVMFCSLKEVWNFPHLATNYSLGWKQE